MMITDKNSKRKPHLMKRPVARHLRVTIAFQLSIFHIHTYNHAGGGGGGGDPTISSLFMK